MKTPAEIRSKIDEYMQKLDRAELPEDHENLCRVIDALLWVIDDTSGAAI